MSSLTCYLFLFALFAATSCGSESSDLYGDLRGRIDDEACSLPEVSDGTCGAVSDCLRTNPGEVQKALCGILEKEGSDNSTTVGDGQGSNPRTGRPDSSSVWGYGFLCVTIISMMSIMGVSVLPFMSKGFYSYMLTGLIGLAVGSLSGSAVFHLIPSAFNLSKLGVYEHHSYLSISLAIWGGAYMFFVIERFLKMVLGYKSKKSGYNMASHGHSHSLSPAGDQPEVRVSDGGNTNSAAEAIDEDEERRMSVMCAGKGMGNLYENSEQAIKSSFGHMERPQPESRPTIDNVRSMGADPKKAPIATVAWMIIFGDGVHNFIDGLSIGAAFSESILTGISVSIAVLCEEFPHELGDFAVLLNSGMTPKQAMMYNFLSACTCYIGLVVGILLGELGGASQYIFGLAGGMFLYIAFVDMIPELNETTDNLAKVSSKKALVTFLLQNMGILLGIFSLYFLAKYQDDIQIGGLV